MARYTGPKTKIARKFGEPIFGPDKVLQKRNFPPGQHGQNRRRKTSEYGIQLREKQKAKYTYGVLEKQFRNLFEKASSMKGITGELLLPLFGRNGFPAGFFRRGNLHFFPQAFQRINHTANRAAGALPAGFHLQLAAAEIARYFHHPVLLRENE